MHGTPPKVEKTTNPTTVFVSMALDMSWKLAIVILVPIIGGFYLDQATKSSPLYTIVGFFLAMGGMALVMWHTLQTANQLPVNNIDNKPKAGK